MSSLSDSNGSAARGAVTAKPGREYWRSLEQLSDTPEFREFLHREFPAGASELLGEDRRQFIKIMGASMALAGLGLAGCRRWPDEEIAPYARRPDGQDPGVQMHYATCREQGGVAHALLATAFDGRPTKVEGNPEDASSAGATDIFGQASILDLYDPDRSRGVRHNGDASDWAAFDAWATTHFGALRQRKGSGLAVLSEATSSPAERAVRQRLQRAMPEMRWYEYEALNNDSVVRGAEMAFGRPERSVLQLELAKTIVCLDADPLGPHPAAVQNIRGFARSRAPQKGADGRLAMSRLYAFESDLTLTGANADVRVPVRSRDVGIIAAYLAARVANQGDLKAIELSDAAKAVITDAVRAELEHAIEDLRKGDAVVVVGERQPPEVHLLGHLLNEAVGSTTGVLRRIPDPDATAHAASIADLVANAASIDTLLIIGGNPVYNAPADLGFAGALGGIDTTIHLSDYVDETSAACTWHLNRAHYLETWGDGRTWDGTYVLAQPLIEPLFLGRSPLEVLAAIGGEPAPGREIVRGTFFEMIRGEDEKRWRRTLHDGFSADPKPTPEDARVKSSAVAGVASAIQPSAADAWEVVFAASPTVYDGRFANNGWMQETPDPITKLTWDNAAKLGRASARLLGVETGDMIEVAVGAAKVQVPVMIVPGIAARSIVLTLGYGRTLQGPSGDPGRIADGAGFDVYPLRNATGMGFADATAVRVPGSYVLATTQDHHTIDVESVGGKGIQQRLGTIFREADLGEFEEDPTFAAHRTHVVHRLSMWEETNLDGAQYRWALSVDLNKCVGCGACVTACQAENNIPIVGKEQVVRGRELHWMRVDRYFAFGERSDGGYDPDVIESVALQPVLCMQCENAPCEQVCPVAATVHDEQGLNVMVYNRCIGTRYCSNNCPYKVRRFNYYDYHRRPPYRTKGMLQVDPDYYTKKQATPDELEQLQFNPEVTVRVRGVMEKCSYCVQRITNARIDAKNAYAQLPEAEKRRRMNDRVPVPDGAVTTACAQTCPAEAIVFGDLADPDSRVSAMHRNDRSYQMLEELNVKARTRYLARLRNPAGPHDLGGHGGHGGDHEDDHGNEPHGAGDDEAHHG